jgi:hypothetical protein
MGGVVTRSPERIRANRDHVEALVAADTFAFLALRVERMLRRGRRISLVTRSPEYPGSEMTVLAGLTVANIERRALTDSCVFNVVLQPGMTAAFGFATPTGENTVTEQEAWQRFYASGDIRYNFTRITLKGGLADDGPARDDRITLDRWNSEGYHSQSVIVFDPGPDPGLLATQAVANVRALLPHLSGEAAVAVSRALDSDVWSVAGAEKIH